MVTVSGSPIPLLVATAPYSAELFGSEKVVNNPFLPCTHSVAMNDREPGEVAVRPKNSDVESLSKN